jgi:hypothetical protein
LRTDDAGQVFAFANKFRRTKAEHLVEVRDGNVFVAADCGKNHSDEQLANAEGHRAE